MHLILAHENADFDAVAALVAAHKLFPDAIPVQPERQNRNVARFLTLYQNGLPLVKRGDINLKQVQRVTLVDTQRPPQIKNLPADVPIDIIDHHPRRDGAGNVVSAHIEVIGSTTTLLVEQIQRTPALELSALEATLLALGIYEDTGSLTYGQTTARDIRAAAWLVEQHADLDAVRRFLEPPFNEAQQALFEQLLNNVDNRLVEGYTIAVATAEVDEYVPEIAGVAHRLREILDPAALFVLVQMPTALHLVCRSTEDAIDAGQVARHFGGGGHGRAAAASLHNIEFTAALAELWAQVKHAVRPSIRVEDLMSHGVHTVDAGAALASVVPQLRRIGHEGYPVVEAGRVVGLLTRRDADRALEHNLGNLTVREVMNVGEITLTPSDSVELLEQRMVESGWGQIPVISDEGTLLGIVTRTDLIKHWARLHPTPTQQEPQRLTLEQVEHVLGAPVAAVIRHIAAEAAKAHVSLYLVGGVVRDLLLARPNFDVDFVVESDAIAFATTLANQFGGQLHSYRPFGTAKWLLDDDVADRLKLDPAALPDHIDFATARNEFYEHPTALPTVYSGSIKLDLQRRDFTINTLAVQYSPPEAEGRVLDFYGGLADLRARRLRVLHSLSFVDDPTRMLRAIRFEQRLGFSIEPRTEELMQTARPMLRRVTGERIRNEIDLLLRENEPERGLISLQNRSLLTAIHPAFTLDAQLPEWFQRARTLTPDWPTLRPELPELYWLLIAAALPVDQVPTLCERLLIGGNRAESMNAASGLVANLPSLERADLRPSQIDAQLSGLSELVLLAVWLAADSDLVRARITTYATSWRSIKPATNGNVLQKRGIKPGPCYSVILSRLRAALLDGEIHDIAGEQTLLEQWLDEGLCDDHT